MEELEARHRKELKALEGEKRAALKKAKSTKGKKAKEALASLETEYDGKLKEVQARHDYELANASSSGSTAVKEAAPASVATAVPGSADEPPVDEAELERQRKQEKARRKREKAREKEREKERQIADEQANAGPSDRDLENAVIRSKLDPLGYEIAEVEADGHCLYRAVAAQCDSDYAAMRRQCADTLAQHADDFAPFCEYNDEVPDFDAYVDRVRSTAEWGGHLELRALAMALRRPVVVYSAQSLHPLTIEEQGCDAENPIRLSYHLKYYALGEHYNQVVVKSS